MLFCKLKGPLIITLSGGFCNNTVSKKKTMKQCEQGLGVTLQKNCTSNSNARLGIFVLQRHFNLKSFHKFCIHCAHPHTSPSAIEVA